MHEDRSEDPAQLTQEIEAELGAEDLRTDVWSVEDSEESIDLAASLGVRVTHMPSGVSAESHALKSQLLNKLEALQRLRSHLRPR